MRLFLRILIWLFVTLWLGALLYFPAVATVAFSQLEDKQQAGAIVRGCLMILHAEGMIAGALLLVLLGAAAATRAFGRSVLGPVCCTLVMLGLTLFSQYHVIPRMEQDRVAVGGDIEKAQGTPQAADFNRLHGASEEIEEGVLVAGILMLVLLARAPKSGLRQPAPPQQR